MIFFFFFFLFFYVSTTAHLTNIEKDKLFFQFFFRLDMCEEDEEFYENIEKCPECQTLTIKLSEDRSYEYCTKCGLITRASIAYTAGQRLDLPYGILIL